MVEAPPRARDLPRRPADNGVKLICDPGQTHPEELARIWLVRKWLVEHLEKLLVTLNPLYEQAYGHNYNPNQENPNELPESDNPAKTA